MRSCNRMLISTKTGDVPRYSIFGAFIAVRTCRQKKMRQGGSNKRMIPEA